MAASTMIKTLFSPARLLAVLNGERFLFQFPRDLGTPDLLQLAMKCGPAPIAVGYDAPALKHVAGTFGEGLALGLTKRHTLGLLTQPAALRKSRGRAALAYFSIAGGKGELFQLCFFDSEGVSLNELELRDLVQGNPFPQETRLSQALSGLAA